MIYKNDLTSIDRLKFDYRIEAGEYLPAPVGLFHALTRNDSIHDLTVLDKTGSRMLKPIVSMALSDMLGLPISFCKPLESYGRMTLVKFVPHGASDPIVPVPMIPMGRAHNRAYSLLVDMFSEWHEYLSTEQQKSFFYRCRECLKEITRQSRDLDYYELRYYHYHIMAAIAMPTDYGMGSMLLQQQANQ